MFLIVSLCIAGLIVFFSGAELFQMIVARQQKVSLPVYAIIVSGLQLIMLFIALVLIQKFTPQTALIQILGFSTAPAIGIINFALGKYFTGLVRREGFCKCGYDLTGNISGVCPECGAPVKRTKEKNIRPPKL